MLDERVKPDSDGGDPSDFQGSSTRQTRSPPCGLSDTVCQAELTFEGPGEGAAQCDVELVTPWRMPNSSATVFGQTRL